PTPTPFPYTTLFRSLPLDLRRASLEPVSEPGVLRAHRLEAAREPRDGARGARGAADRFGALPERRGNPVWALLGRDRARAALALRVLLLPADRVRDRPRHRGIRGRRPGRAQAVPRAAAGGGAVGALARPSALRARGRSLPRARRRRRAALRRRAVRP